LIHFDQLAWRYRDCVPVALLSQPFGDRGRCQERNVGWKRVQRIEGEVIGVCVCNENRIQLGKRFERDPGCAHTGKDFTKRRVEVRVGEKALSADLN
jgi:hypothetical protein